MSVEKMSFNKSSAPNSASLEKQNSSIDIRGALSSINLQKTFDIASRMAVSYKNNFAIKN